MTKENPAGYRRTTGPGRRVSSSRSGPGGFPLLVLAGGHAGAALGRLRRRGSDPDEDLPRDFEAYRAAHNAAPRKPVDPTTFIDQLREEMRIDT
jgi:hypothetical protein